MHCYSILVALMIHTTRTYLHFLGSRLLLEVQLHPVVLWVLVVQGSQAFLVFQPRQWVLRVPRVPLRLYLLAPRRVQRVLFEFDDSDYNVFLITDAVLQQLV